ncbi:MAG: saccharopine dehydrogenase family protein [Pseudonocardiaceae bacterium]
MPAHGHRTADNDGRTRALVVGAGKIGTAIAGLLASAPEYDVSVLERSERALRRVAALGVRAEQGDITDAALLGRLTSSHDMVLSAVPFQLTTTIARAAREAGAHYFDLTEDRACARAVAEMATDAPTVLMPRVLMPQCGLAPGFVSVVAAALANSFDELRSVSLRVGALPQFPTNALKYNLTWSTEGLINEYCNPCEAIVDGELREVPPLEGLAEFCLDGVTYEAFNTSGGLGTLGESLLGRLESLSYQTVRYPGHCEIVKLLVRDLRLAHRRDVLKNVLETAIPVTDQDVVLIFVSVSGIRAGVLTQQSFARKVYPADVGGLRLSAIQLTTAAGICAMADLVRQEKLPTCGFVRQEECALEEFLANRFGSLYLRGQEVATR